MSSILDIFNKYSKEKLVGYFLLLWGLGDLLSVASGLSYSLTHLGFGIIWDLAWAVLDLLTGLVLIVLGNKVLKESE